MNNINKDRTTLKKLVESYGKKDVLNFVRHLNESNTYDENDANIYDDLMKRKLINAHNVFKRYENSISRILSLDDSYDVFNSDFSLIEKIFDYFGYEVSIIANIPELLDILKKRYPEFKVLFTGENWAVVLWNPEEGVLAPGYLDDELNDYAVELLPYDSDHISIEEVRNCWKLYKQAYLNTLP